jgi:hypothetical protein
MRSFSKSVRNSTRESNSIRSASLRSSLYLIFAVPLIASCTIASNQTGPDRPVSIADDVESIRRIAYPPDLTGFYALSLGNQASSRNQIATARMYIADLEYHYYEARLTREMQDEGLLATAVSLGLTGSASLIPVAQTSRLLSGIATGVIGLDKAYNEKELLSNTIQALQTQMRADRKAWAAEIQAKMVKADKITITPIAEYTLAMALSDADAYYQAGTLASALIGLSKTVANAETNAAQAKADSGPNAAAVSQARATANHTAPPAVSAPGRVTVIRDVNTQLAKQDKRVALDTSGEPTDPPTIASIRKALCLSPNGGLDDMAHKRLGIYLNSINQGQSERFAAREMTLLRRLINNNKTADCSLFS